MKKLLYILIAAALVFSCNIYDDTWIQEELERQKDAVSKLESDCQSWNDNLTALEQILTSLQDNDYIKSVSTIEKNGKVTGYQLTFQKRGIVIINHGQDGQDGKDGQDGEDGQDGKDAKDGKDGKDAGQPTIGVKQDTDGKWYWTVDNNWCLDDKGNKVPAISNDDVTPMMKIEEGYWYVSFDNGATWEMMTYADGLHGDLIFSDVDFDESYLYITLSDGTVLEIPRLSDLSVELGKLPSRIKANSTFKVTYKIKGGSGNAEVSCIGEHGWTGVLIPTDKTSGSIEVTSPQSLVKGKIVIFVNDGDTTIMQALLFDGDDDMGSYISVKCDYYELDGTGGFVEVSLRSNDYYSIEIPDEAESWISHVQTRAVKEDKILLAISPNKPGNPSREATVTFTTDDESAEILIHQKASPYIDSEVDLGPIDGFDDPENGIVILQQATKGSGADIVIMGDGFSKRHFVKGGRYETIMRQAYEDFFSVEPYASLKEYFNVYYINVLSEDDHDAVPYYDYYSSQNGATQGSANTRLKTTFVPGSTSISGDNDLVLKYAAQAIQYKGGPYGAACSSTEATNRANLALSIIMTNVECYAGTCWLAWRSSTSLDYGCSYSIAYCSLGSDNTGRECKYTLIHEAGGHGFGKLADEYSGYSITSFNTREWYNLRDFHSYGVYRNANEYWTYEESLGWSGLDWEFTTKDNVYWSELLSDSYDYDETEGLGIYEGAYTYDNLFCRSTNNSMMNNQLSSNGQFFNAISRWAIWYRLMRLTSSSYADQFKDSLDDFIEFDNTLSIIKNQAAANTGSGTNLVEEFRPLGPPVLIEIK